MLSMAYNCPHLRNLLPKLPVASGGKKKWKWTVMHYHQHFRLLTSGFLSHFFCEVEIGSSISAHRDPLPKLPVTSGGREKWKWAAMHYHQHFRLLTSGFLSHFFCEVEIGRPHPDPLQGRGRCYYIIPPFPKICNRQDNSNNRPKGLLLFWF